MMPLVSLVQFKVLTLHFYRNYLENKIHPRSIRDQVIDMPGVFCLVFTAPAKWRVDLRAKIGRYRNTFFREIDFY